MNTIRFQPLNLFVSFILAALVLIFLLSGNAPALAAANLVTGAIAVPGERDTYVLTVDHESRYYFDSWTNTPSLMWTLRGPYGVVIGNRGFSSSDAQTIGD